jgi:hypothetical protein
MRQRRAAERRAGTVPRVPVIPAGGQDDHAPQLPATMIRLKVGGLPLSPGVEACSEPASKGVSEKCRLLPPCPRPP